MPKFHPPYFFDYCPQFGAQTGFPGARPPFPVSQGRLRGNGSVPAALPGVPVIFRADEQFLFLQLRQVSVGAFEVFLL